MRAAMLQWRRLAAEERRAREHKALEDEFERRLQERLALARSDTEGLLATRDAAHHAARQDLERRLAAAQAALSRSLSDQDRRTRELQERGMRRILNLGLARALSAWAEQGEQRRRLKQAAGRLRHPGLAPAFATWRAERERERREREARELELSFEARMQERLALARSDSEKELALKEIEEALRRQEAEARLNDLERGMLAEKAKHDAKVKLAQEQGLRRLMNLPLAHGFGAWRAMVEERRRLRQAVARMLVPGLAAAFAEWKTISLAMARAAREAALEARYREQMELRLGLIRSDSEGVLRWFFFLRRFESRLRRS
jgi:hypothetical protein